MSALRRLSIIDQTAEHLRQGLRDGRWHDNLPGLRPLAVELGVSRPTLRAAIKRLDGEGLLMREGPREPRAISKGVGRIPEVRPSLRIAVLSPLGLHNEGAHKQHLLHTLIGSLQGAGHTCILVALPSGSDPHKTGRLAHLVKNTRADAWIVNDGTHELLSWFAKQKLPVLALGGRARTLPLANIGYYSEEALRRSLRKLISHGHRRIVYICPSTFLHPEPSGHIIAFREELTGAGIAVGAYNTPEWEESPHGLVRLLESLFKVTPPTALILWHNLHASGVLSFLEARGLHAPADVSLITMERDPSIVWRYPDMDMACFDKRRDDDVLSRVIRWIDSVAAGRPDTESRLFQSEFHEGNTTGPAKKV